MKHLKKNLTKLALLVIAAMLPQLASAFNIDGIEYNINNDGNSVTVTGHSADLPGDLVIPESVTYNGKTYAVTTVYGGSFIDCQLNSVVWNARNCNIFDDGTSGSNGSGQGNDGFYTESYYYHHYFNPFCHEYHFEYHYYVDISDENDEFPIWIEDESRSYSENNYDSNTSINSFTFGKDVESIPARLCEGLEGLTEIYCYIPEPLTINENVFSNYNIDLYVPAASVSKYQTTYPWSKFNVIAAPPLPPQGLVFEYHNDGTAAVTGYTSDLPSDLVIPESVFYNGNTYSVTSVGDWAFSGCSGLISITIPNSVKWISDDAFRFCANLSSLVVESGNTIYDSRNNCNALIITKYNTLIAGCKNTTIPNSVTSIGDEAFWGCSGLISVTIPDSVTSIGGAAFLGCTNLTSVTIGNSVKWIGDGAFENCSGLISVTIPNSVTSIGGGAFSGCSGLTSMTIPNSVTSIGGYAFGDCTGLTSIYSKIKNPQAVYYESDVFNGVSTNQCPLYVPKGKYDIYSATSPWSDFTNIIETDPTGDVNDDGSVNVTDYVATASYILEMNPDPFYFMECDFDDNGTITVGDLVGVATRVLSFEGIAQCIMHNAQCTIQNEECSMGAVIKGNEITINLSNNIDLTAMQMDLNLPVGMTLVDASLSDRASSSHQVAFNRLSNGDYRLLASSPMCKAFTGNDGAVLTLTLAGEPSGNGIVRNIELATPRAASYKARDIELNFGTTGVENARTATAHIYSDGSNIVIDSPVASTAQIILPNGMTQTVTVTAGKNVFPAPASGVIIVKMGDKNEKLLIK